MVILPDSFYARDTVTVAKELLGTFLVLTNTDGQKVGMITETEAYPGLGDKASHSSRGLTSRTSTLFGPTGHWYVYMIYGMYYCLNVVTDTPESGGAVLIRIIEPIKGITGKSSGPGLLCKALEIDKSINGLRIADSELVIQAARLPHTLAPYTAHPRVGIDYAGADKDLPYRFRIAKTGDVAVR